MANKLRASEQIQDKDRYITISETKRQVVAMLTEIQLEIEEYKRDLSNKDITKDHEDFDHNNLIEVISGNIQQKIDLLQKQTTDNCDNCFNGTTKGGCAVKELMKNKVCEYYMPRENQCFKGE